MSFENIYFMSSPPPSGTILGRNLCPALPPPHGEATTEIRVSRNRDSSSGSFRQEVVKWLSDPRFTHALTLNINRRESSLRTAGKLFGLFCRDVDRMMLGKRRVERLHTCERLEAIAFPEHIETNLHLHVVANFARRYWGGRSITAEQEAELARIWHRVTRGSGTSEIKLMRDAGWARYVTKEIYRPGHDYIHSADFHSDRYVVFSLPSLEGLTS